MYPYRIVIPACPTWPQVQLVHKSASAVPAPASVAARPVATPSAAFSGRPKPGPAEAGWPSGRDGTVSIGGRAFEQLRMLGKGSFGVVWEVQDAGGSSPSEEARPTLALKCSTPANQQMLDACLLEAKVLQLLADALPAGLEGNHRVPQYVAHCVRQPAMAGGQNQVLTAMSRLEGKPVDQWLYGVDENRLKVISLSELLEGPLPGGQLATRDLAGASAAAAALCSQMAPVFGALSKIAFHRDVSAHNFLVREEAGAEEFALLDFGLAVRSPGWEDECKVQSISGDPRYFSPAAWMLMVYGYRYLEKHPDGSFLEQYRSRIDHFSFGVLLLEVLFALWKGPEAEGRTVADAGRGKALMAARAAWRAFWADAMAFFQLFHRSGANATREQLKRSVAIPGYQQKLGALCSALRAACRFLPDSTAGAVFRAAAGLIDPHSSLSWGELCALLETARAPAAGEAGAGEAAEAGPEGARPRGPEASEAPEAGEIADGARGRATELPGEAVARDGAGAEEVIARPPQEVTPRRVQRYSHRRNWTVDEAVSLTRGAPEMSVGWGSPAVRTCRAPLGSVREL